MYEDKDDIGYNWEYGYEKTWEGVREDATGNVYDLQSESKTSLKRKQKSINSNIRIGMIRHLYVVVDASPAMLDRDLRPNRLILTVKCVQNFIEQFLDENPISQIGVIITYDRKAEKLTELSANIRHHSDALASLIDLSPSSTTKSAKLDRRKLIGAANGGPPSLLNAMKLAQASLRHSRAHISREILFVIGSLTSCDSHNVLEAAQFAREQHRISVSVISLAAEVFLYAELARVTAGLFQVVQDETDLPVRLRNLSKPRPDTGNIEPTLILMGFPTAITTQSTTPGGAIALEKRCLAHANERNSACQIDQQHYRCPRCSGTYCELPVVCVICDLMLISAPHLTRSYHHLFPLNPFDELSNSDTQAVTQSATAEEAPEKCAGCDNPMKSDKIIYQCPKCASKFCHVCDDFLHFFVHFCPYC